MAEALPGACARQLVVADVTVQWWYGKTGGVKITCMNPSDNVMNRRICGDK